LCCLFFCLLAIVLSVLLSFGHCVVCSSVICLLCCLFFCLLSIVLSILLSFAHKYKVDHLAISNIIYYPHSLRHHFCIQDINAYIII
jgi:hypothetical protein